MTLLHETRGPKFRPSRDLESNVIARPRLGAPVQSWDRHRVDLLELVPVKSSSIINMGVRVPSY